MLWSGRVSRRPDARRGAAARRALALGGALAATLAGAQSAWVDAGDYVHDLDRVYDAILAVRFVKEVCAESFPALAADHAVAFERWRARYAPFHREIEQHHARRLQREAAGDPARYAEVLRRWDESSRYYRETLAMQLLVEGPEVFQGECRVYAKYLASDAADLEHRLATHVASIRRGPR